MSFTADDVVLVVIGEVDLATAPFLSGALTAAESRGRSITIDLAGTGFLGLEGLAAVATTALRLAARGRRLTLRAPSPLFSRMLDLAGLTQLVGIAPTVDRRHDLGSEQTTPAARPPRRADGTGLPHHLRRVAAIPADEDVVDGALRLVVALARAAVGGADGVSVSLQRHGRLTTVAASDQTIRDMDADQYATAEGPCVDASTTGRWFHAEALDQETRWPAFTPRARDLGINAILSTPLLVDERPVGALNIYSRTVGAFAAADQELAATFAAEASLLLGRAGVDVSDDQVSVRITQALRTRRSIAQAQGVLMEREGIGPEAAYTLLRSFSRQTSQPLGERAADIAESAQRHPAAPGTGGEEQTWLVS